MILLGPFYTTLGWRGSRFELSNTAENTVIKGVNRAWIMQLTQVYDLAMQLPDVLLAALIVWGIVWLIFR